MVGGDGSRGSGDDGCHGRVRLGHHGRGERGGGAVLGGSTSDEPSGFRRTASLRAGRTGDGGLLVGRAWGTGVSDIDIGESLT